MPRRTFAMVLIFVLFALPQSVSGTGAASVTAPQESNVDAYPTIFGKDVGLTDLNSVRLETLKLTGSRLENSHVSASEAMLERYGTVPVRSGSRKRIALSILFSALLPGAGEFYLFLDSKQKSVLARASVFMALEGYLWYGYHHNHSWGEELKRKYEEYADAHWDLDRFLHQHPCCSPPFGCESYEEYNEICSGELYFLFIPKEVDREEYYENIGKYDSFVFGWDDWDNQLDYWTPHRQTYWQMRVDSNDYLLKGDQHLMLLLVNRVISIIDAGWLAYRMGKGERDDDGWSIELDSRFSVASVAVRYSF
ncbi:MAG: hypothetical protein JSV33_06865 [bacterium]|nr:MAG: hypothetical protein JSV33_06865 [bacterium]